MKTVRKINNINESSRRQKAVKALSGNPNIRSMCILTSENPRYPGFPDGDINMSNSERRENLEKDLKLGHYAWFPVKGHYEDKEKSYIIYNISKDNAAYLAEKYGQEAFIFIEGNICEYYEYSDNNKYVKTHVRKLSDRIDMSNADDYFTQISRSFKFQIPFFDGSDDHKTIMSESFKYLNDVINSADDLNEAQRRITNSIESPSGQYRFYNRSFVYKDKFMWD